MANSTGSPVPPAIGQSLPIAESLQEAADPALLIDGAGAVRWRNAAANRIPGSTGPLDRWLEAETVKQILATTQFAAIPCVIPISGATEQRVSQTAIVLEIGSGDPASCLFLVSFRATSAPAETLRERTEFLATVAHDLKNPLGAIFGYVDALLDTRAGEGLSVAHRETIRRVRRAALRSIDLVRNYQLLAQRGQLRAPPPDTAVNIRTVIESVLEYCMRTGEGEPALDMSFPSNELWVCVERTPLERLVANLVANAYAYTPPNGRISISATRAGSSIVLEVSNTGQPLSDDELAEIFKPYQRGRVEENQHNSRKAAEVRHGSGLGLSIVQAIVASAAGEISARSEPSRGTVFVVHLPVARSGGPAAAV